MLTYGSTGTSTGAHLHYEVQPSGSGQNSANCLDSRNREHVLLPDASFKNSNNVEIFFLRN